MRNMSLVLALILAAPAAGQQVDDGQASAHADEANCRYCFQDGVEARQRGEFEIALRYFMIGCEREDGASCSMASIMFSNGQGAAEDDQRAYELGLRGCNLDYFRGCSDLGLSLVSASRPEVAAKGRELLERACEGGRTTACEYLASEKRDTPAKTTIGTLQIGQGDETATFSNVSSSCGMLRLTLAFGTAAAPVRQCLGTSDTRRIKVVTEDGRVTSSSVEPDDSVGRCVISALSRAHIEGLTCRLEADVSR